SLYYEKRGAWGDSSRPILLLHGNGESMEVFDEATKPLYENFAFLALDSRGHGKSQKPCGISYELMASDVYSVLEHEGIDSCDIVGFSDGAITAFLLAMKFSHKINKIIAIGGNANPKGLKFSVRTEIRKDKLGLEKQGDAFGVALCNLMLHQPNISFKELAKIKAQTVIVVGSKDMVKHSHTKKIAKSIPNSKLIVTKGAGHFIPQDRPNELREIILHELG
ncbi:MAG: alpha/beta hydrolase, partial [Clostridiales bacterium]|nr:alpha/beta hydrolase [Clostridiales bacterium]